jgi:hypothetical protein
MSVLKLLLVWSDFFTVNMAEVPERWPLSHGSHKIARGPKVKAQENLPLVKV